MYSKGFAYKYFFHKLTKALGKICLLVYEDLGRNDGPKGIESL